MRAIASLRGRNFDVTPRPLAPGDNPLAAAHVRHFDLEAEIEVGEATEIGFMIRGVPVRYDVHRQELTTEKMTVPVPLDESRLKLRLLGDQMSLEIFAQHGVVYLPLKISAPPENQSLELFARGGRAQVRSLQLHELNSIWPTPQAQ